MNEAGTMSDGEGRRVGVHVLGAADLDADSVEAFREALADLERLPDEETRWARLSRAPRGTSPTGVRFATGPLPGLLEAGCRGVLLVLTRQDPPHPGDTWRLAELVRPVLESRGVAVGMAEVRYFDVDSFRVAVQVELPRLVARLRAEEVLLAVGGGPKLGFVGALLGVAQAGYVPRVLEPRLEGATRRAPRVLSMQADLVPWLVRTHRYDVLADLAEISDAERRVWRTLAAARTLDWRALARARVEASELEAVRRRHPGLAVPDLPATPPLGVRPPDPAGWRWYRRMLQASLLVRTADDPLSALYLARPWTECHVRELADRDPVNGRHRMVAALDGPDADEALGVLLERWSELAPGPIRTLLGTPAVQELCRLGVLASHGRLADHDWPRHRFDTVAALAQDLGATAASPIADLLVLMAVGRTERWKERGWSPEAQADSALGAIVEYLAVRLLPRERVHLRLVTSGPVQAHARRIEVGAAQRRFGSARLIMVDPDDIGAAVAEVVRHLEDDPALTGCSEVLLVVGPGTKPMNLAMALGGGQWGTNRVLPLRVAYLRAWESGGQWSSVLEETRDRVLPRLGPDRVVAPILLFALRRLDLGTLRHALELGSDRWQGLAQRVVELQRLVTPVREGRRGAPDPRAWFPARALAFAGLAEDDPWRAIYATCAAAEAAWPWSGRNRRGYGVSPWRTPGRPCGHELWRVRNLGPFGHRVWEPPPLAGEVRRLIEAVVEEVGQDPPGGPVAFEPSDAITRRVGELVAEIGRLAPRPAAVKPSPSSGTTDQESS